MATIEFKNQETETAFMRSIIPTQKPIKIAYQKWRNGKPVFTLLTRD